MIPWKKPPTSLEHVPSLAASGLLKRYFCDPEFAQAFYAGPPGEAKTAEAHAGTLAGRTYPRAELAAALKDQNRAWGMSRETEEGIHALARGALCVFTGQQTGLFTGPLYTMYKALTAVRLARHFAEMLGAPVVPVFWLAADDHDLDEIDHAVMPGEEGPITVRYAMSVGGAAPRVSRLTFGDDIEQWVGDALAALPDGPGHDEAKKAARAAYRPGSSWVDAFARLMSRWLGRFGLILVTPDDSRLKRLMAPAFREEIAAPERSRRAIELRNRAIEAAGYSPQVGLADRATFLFIDDEAGARRRVDVDGDGFVWEGPDAACTREVLSDLLEREPERFSANVLFRPVTADFIFPTLAQVMGPGEVAYMAQASALYERHGVPMPLVVPRARFTLVPGEIERMIVEQGLEIEDAFQPLDRWIGALAAREMSRSFGGLVEGCRRDLDEAYERLYGEVRERLPGIWNAVTSARVKTQALMNKLERKMEQEMRRRERARADSLETVAHALYPHGAPQERVYTALPYLSRYGSGLLDAVLDAVAVGGGDAADHRALWLPE